MKNTKQDEPKKKLEFSMHCLPPKSMKIIFEPICLSIVLYFLAHICVHHKKTTTGKV